MSNNLAPPAAERVVAKSDTPDLDLPTMVRSLERKRDDLQDTIKHNNEAVAALDLATKAARDELGTVKRLLSAAKGRAQRKVPAASKQAAK